MSGQDLAGFSRHVASLDEVLTALSRKVGEVEQTIPVIRGEVAEALQRVDSRFNAARASEERTRRMARDAAEREDGDQTLSEAEFLALAGSQEAEAPDSHQLSWPDIERLAFERRQGNRGR